MNHAVEKGKGGAGDVVVSLWARLLLIRQSETLKEAYPIAGVGFYNILITIYMCISYKYISEI